MPVVFEQLPNEPILIFSFTGWVSPEDLQVMYTTSVKMAEQHNTRIYRIANYVAAENATLADLRQIMQAIAEQVPGSAGDSRMTTVIVDQHPEMREILIMARQPQYGGVELALFGDLPSALTAVRLVIHELKRQQTG